MIFDIPQSKLDEWKFTCPRLRVLNEIVKKHEIALESGKNVIFPINELMKDFGYTPDRYIRHNSFTQQIKSDITMFDPFKLNGGRLAFGSYGHEGGEKKVYFNYIRQQELKLTVEAEIRDGNKNFSEAEGEN